MIINDLKMSFGWGNQQLAADTGKISLSDDFLRQGLDHWPGPVAGRPILL